MSAWFGPTWKACMIILALGCLSCGGPSRHETFIKDGRRAETQEQWVQAAAMYQQACNIKPGDTATCQRAQEMRTYAVNLRSYEAKKLCNQGKLRECLATLSEVRKLDTGNRGKIMEVLEQASRLAIKQCLKSDQDRRHLAPALSELRCLVGERVDLWEAPTYRAHYERRSRSIAGQLRERAQGAAKEAVGTKLSFLQAAECLFPASAPDQQAIASLNQSFQFESRTHLALQYTANGTTRPARGTCLDIANKIGRGLKCELAEAKVNPPLAMRAEVFSLTPRWQRSHQDRRESVRYKSGTETRNNPDYERARVEYELADGRYRDAERVTRDRESTCRSTKDDSDCDAYESAEDTSSDRLRDLNRARQHYHQVPATITEDVYEDHSYVARDHRWAAPFRASIRVGAQAANTEITEIVYTDSEQPGFSPAGVRADRFDPPQKNFFRDESSRWLTARIEDRLLGELSRRAKDLVQSCRGDRVACWARASYWLGTTNFGLPLLQQLSTDELLPALECTGQLLQL